MANFNEFVNRNSTTKHNNTFINAMKNIETMDKNWKTTENGATAKSTTDSHLYDLFALGGAYRGRSELDCLNLFKRAYDENPSYALKCLWYIRDVEDGLGERRFFRICLKWLATTHPQIVARNMASVPRDNFGRWDDLFVLFHTSCEESMLELIKNQLNADIDTYQSNDKAAVSLLAKWLPSVNCSSSTNKQYARTIAKYLGVTERTYRKMLSLLRERLHIVERLMSQNRWEEIDFSHLPSRAGLIYRNCFKNKGLIAEKYREFAQDKNATVNAGKLFPYDILTQARHFIYSTNYNDTERLIVNKYWDNLPNVFPENTSFNAMVVCDTSGSMTSRLSYNSSLAPIDVAVSLAMYAAERANGPFKNHYISFSRTARLVEISGHDFCEKVSRIVRSNVCENTNLESVFNLVLRTAMSNNLRPSDMPKTLIVISDMEVDASAGISHTKETFMASMKRKWCETCKGKYDFPNIVFWNVSARNDTFLADPASGITFVSGFSANIFQQVMSNKTSIELMFDKLNSERYANIK